MSSHIQYFTSGQRQDIAQQLLNTDERGDFEAFFVLFGELLRRANARIGPDQKRLRHTDVLNIANDLKGDPTRNLQQVQNDLASTPHRLPSEISDLIAIAAQVMFLVDTRAANWHTRSFFLGTYTPRSWALTESFSDYIQGRLPAQATGGHSHRVTLALQNTRLLSARNLKRELGITFKRTDDLAQHLVLDMQRQVLYLFDQTAVLKAHLARATRPNDNAPMVDCLRSGTLPQPCILDTLDSLYTILFPQGKKGSREIVKSLIRSGFDKDLGRYDGYDNSLSNGHLYWGERLAILYETVLEKPPKTRLGRWVESQTTDRNALTVALCALVISIVIGLLSLVIAAVQTWISWQAWKRPASGQ